MPAFAINNNEQKVTPYPRDGDLTVSELKKWITKFLKGQLSFKDSGFGEVIDVDIKYTLSATKNLKRKKFNELVYEEGKDVFLFLYSTGFEDET